MEDQVLVEDPVTDGSNRIIDIFNFLMKWITIRRRRGQCAWEAENSEPLVGDCSTWFMFRGTLSVFDRRYYRRNKLTVHVLFHHVNAHHVIS